MPFSLLQAFLYLSLFCHFLSARVGVSCDLALISVRLVTVLLLLILCLYCMFLFGLYFSLQVPED